MLTPPCSPGFSLRELEWVGVGFSFAPLPSLPPPCCGSLCWWLLLLHHGHLVTGTKMVAALWDPRVNLVEGPVPLTCIVPGCKRFILAWSGLFLCLWTLPWWSIPELPIGKFPCWAIPFEWHISRKAQSWPLLLCPPLYGNSILMLQSVGIQVATYWSTLHLPFLSNSLFPLLQ